MHMVFANVILLNVKLMAHTDLTDNLTRSQLHFASQNMIAVFGNPRDHGKCPFFSTKIVHADGHALILNFVKTMNINKYLSIFYEMEIVMHTKLREV